LILDKKVAVVMPAHNASTTLEQTWSEIPHEIIDEIILVDDYSSDDTVQKARNLGIQYVIEHDRNKGYGGNQKSCYRKSLELGVDIIVMLHPDYQYPPKLIYPMCYLIAQGLYPVVLGSRILGGSALSDGMPVYKYISNRVLTFVENMFLGLKLSEYHTGYRAIDAKVLRQIRFEENSDDFVFDNQILSQIAMANYKIGEISCPAKYFPEASSINLPRSIVYGLGVLKTILTHTLHRTGLIRFSRYARAESGSNV